MAQPVSSLSKCHNRLLCCGRIKGLKWGKTWNQNRLPTPVSHGQHLSQETCQTCAIKNHFLQIILFEWWSMFGILSMAWCKLRTWSKKKEVGAPLELLTTTLFLSLGDPRSALGLRTLRDTYHDRKNPSNKTVKVDSKNCNSLSEYSNSCFFSVSYKNWRNRHIFIFIHPQIAKQQWLCSWFHRWVWLEPAPKHVCSSNAVLPRWLPEPLPGGDPSRWRFGWNDISRNAKLIYTNVKHYSKLYTLSYRNGVYIISLLPKNVDILKIWSWMKLISILIFAPLQAPRMKRAKSKISDPSKISSHPNPSAPLSISFGWHDKTPRKPSVRRFVDVTDLEIPHSYTAQCIKRIKHVFCTKVMHKLSPILWHDLNAQSSSQNVALCHPTGARKAKTV